MRGSHLSKLYIVNARVKKLVFIFAAIITVALIATGLRMAFAFSENVDKGTNKTINDTTLVSFEQQAKKTGIDVTTNTKTSIQNDNHIIKNDKVNKIGIHRSNNPAIKEKEVTITFDSFLGDDMLIYNRSTQQFSYLESGGQIRYGLDDDEELYCQALYYDFGVETKSPTLIFCAVDSDGNITGYFNWCLYGADGYFVSEGFLDYDCFSVGGKKVPFSNSRSKLTPITDGEVFCYQTEESTKSLVCRFEGNGGTWDDILEYDVIQSPGDIFKLPSKDPYKNEDMHFDGYDYEGSKILENTEVPVNYGITAQTRWCNIVSYDYNGGEGPAETSVKKLENAKDFFFMIIPRLQNLARNY
ncbi:MAG: hypothetical protein Q4E88_00980 [Coriobacteriia bacterium]|nr:hypothetical protein [Coriobacteriia bacterium]